MHFSCAVKISPYFTGFVDFTFDGSHGIAAFLADNLAGKPTGAIAHAVPDLLVFFKFTLAFKPDVRINNTLM
jgi:hypothetical protein